MKRNKYRFCQLLANKTITQDIFRAFECNWDASKMPKTSAEWYQVGMEAATNIDALYVKRIRKCRSR
jgi:hypothetical protein